MQRRLSRTGFTIIELMVTIVIFSALATLALTNIRGVRAEKRDAQRKTDINAIYYQLESFHEVNGYYPETVNAKNLKGIDPESLIDNTGKTINQPGSLYAYDPTDCSDAKCKSYSLSTALESEATYQKISLIQ